MRDIIEAFSGRSFALILLDLFILVLVVGLVSTLVGAAPVPRPAMPVFQEATVTAAADSAADRPAPACLSETEMRAAITRDVPDAVVEVQRDAAGYMRLFNALPPATSKPVPAVMLVAASPSLPTVLVLGFNAQACLTLYGTVRKEDHARLLERLNESI